MIQFRSFYSVYFYLFTRPRCTLSTGGNASPQGLGPGFRGAAESNYPPQQGRHPRSTAGGRLRIWFIFGRCASSSSCWKAGLLLSFFNIVTCCSTAKPFLFPFVGASLDRRSGKLIESKPKVLYEQMPVIYIYAINTTAGKDPRLYECPIYRKPQRTDQKYVGSIDFETDFNPRHWTLRGVALLCDIK